MLGVKGVRMCKEAATALGRDTRSEDAENGSTDKNPAQVGSSHGLVGGLQVGRRCVQVLVYLKSPQKEEIQWGNDHHAAAGKI